MPVSISPEGLSLDDFTGLKRVTMEATSRRIKRATQVKTVRMGIFHDGGRRYSGAAFVVQEADFL